MGYADEVPLATQRTESAADQAFGRNINRVSGPVARPAEPTPALHANMEQLVERLWRIHRSVEQTADRVAGYASGSDATTEAQPDQPMTPLNVWLDRAHGVVGRIEAQLSRLEGTI